MEHTEFAIGRVFTGHSLWRSTDIGTRTVVAIRLDRVEVVTLRGGREEQRVIDPRRESGWLSGPPYIAEEVVFDSCDFPACHPVAEADVMGWTQRPGRASAGCQLDSQALSPIERKETE